MSIERENSILEKISIMIDMLMGMFGITYTLGYSLIRRSNLFRLLISGDYSTLYDSPQASLIELGKEPQFLKYNINEDSVVNYMLSISKLN